VGTTNASTEQVVRPVTQSSIVERIVKRGMTFASFAEILEQLEQTASSLKMIHGLSRLFAHLKLEEAREAAYLLQGKMGPDYAGIEFGMAEKLAMRAIAASADKPLHRVAADFHRSGDLGDVAAKHAAARASIGLTLREVFKRLREIAAAKGAGAQATKLRRLADLLQQCSGREAKYAVRIVLGTLRLGVAEMTLLYGLSEALTGSKAAKPTLENAFNVLSDLGEVTERALRWGVKGLKRVRPIAGTPVRMMLAQRIKDLAEIPEHIPGLLHVEYKYDGERVQGHIEKGGHITLYSRRQENITYQYPDIVRALQASFRGQDAIVEGEAVAVEVETGKLKDFQTLMRRRRKHDVEAYMTKVLVKCFLFDLLYLDGRSLMSDTLARRKNALRRCVRTNDGVALATFIATRDIEEIESFFAAATERGAEGVMVKDAQSPYEAGTRGWRWMKYKKEYRKGLADTFDLVVIGGIYGQGLRTGTFGSLLVAAFNPQTNRYESLTKVGAGFSDAELARLPKLLKSYQLSGKHHLVATDVKADVWFKPALVMEVMGAQLTVSPVHAVARDRVKKGGLALRFPRFLRWRDDKGVAQATTAQEIYQLYQRSRRRNQATLRVRNGRRARPRKGS
jgi:DNA ligase-1